MSTTLVEDLDITIPEPEMVDSAAPNVELASSQLGELEIVRTQIADKCDEHKITLGDNSLEVALSASLGAIDSLLFLMTFDLNYQNAQNDEEREEAQTQINEYVESYNAYIANFKDNLDDALIELQDVLQLGEA